MFHRSSTKAAVAASIGATMLVSGCGAGSRSADQTAPEVACDFEAPSSPTTVNVLAYNSSAIDPFTNALVANCSKDDVSVVHEPVDFAGQVQRTTTTLAGSSGTYDIIETYGMIIPENAETERLIPLDDLVEQHSAQYGLDELNPQMIEAMSYEGSLYALPMQAQVFVMAYRTDIFDDLGLEPPTTFDELGDVAQEIQDQGEMSYPLALPLHTSSDLLTAYDSALGSLGVDLVDHEAQTPNFDQPEAIQAFEALLELRPFLDPQVTTFDQPAVQQQMYNGSAAISIMFSGRMNDLVQEGNSQYFDDIGFAAPPVVGDGEYQYSALSVDGWSIPANTDVDDELLFHMIASSVGEDSSEAAIPDAYPAREGIVTEENSPYADAANDAIGSAPPVEPHPYIPRVGNAILPIIAQVFNGDLTPEDGAERMQDDAQDVLDAE
ncbi:ABC transporter substrate-binding protein [Nesterenkonia xinjiangensis]|uniref:Sorbitol/mannitol transport system substrate-binding protein n=1 Tax=Nesterenkonia xinjiangensis TaxID=225327 RepID=A0A7Z0K9J1_9MICC|nr:extracellular solute-binding protein [Nesterenkonia xinjiangensis]NYJ77270.1 sorbitol/mannitol transport system substrate-binding protein [Nesterenkonia xinjiangensis]